MRLILEKKQKQKTTNINNHNMPIIWHITHTMPSQFEVFEVQLVLSLLFFLGFQVTAALKKQNVLLYCRRL